MLCYARLCYTLVLRSSPYTPPKPPQSPSGSLKAPMPHQGPSKPHQGILKAPSCPVNAPSRPVMPLQGSLKPFFILSRALSNIL